MSSIDFIGFLHIAQAAGRVQRLQRHGTGFRPPATASPDSRTGGVAMSQPQNFLTNPIAFTLQFNASSLPEDFT